MNPLRRPARRALGVIVVVAFLASCGGDGGVSADLDGGDGASATPADLVTELNERGLASAASALENLDLGELAGTEDYTFLAPNDEAFLALSVDEAVDVMASDETLGIVMKNHLIEGRLEFDDLNGIESITAMSGKELAVDMTPEGPTIGGALVSETDIEPGGRLIHIVDKVFLP